MLPEEWEECKCEEKELKKTRCITQDIEISFSNDDDDDADDDEGSREEESCE